MFFEFEFSSSFLTRGHKLRPSPHAAPSSHLDKEEMAIDPVEAEPEQQEAAAVAEVTAVVHGHGGATAIHAPSRSRPGIPRT